MKKIFALFLIVSSVVACKKNNPEGPSPALHPKADSLVKLMKKYTSQGIPGTAIAIKDPSGFWAGAEGFSNLESHTKMSSDQLQYGFSVTKMVTAISVMQLKQRGLINLNLPIKNYLPTELQSLVPLTTVVTVKMLLNHTSGYNDYVRLDEFADRWLQNPLKVWKREEYYDLIRRNIVNDFTPGTDFLYSNTNYYLLSVIIDKITAQPHSRWFQQNIFDRLALTQTFYKNAAGYPFYHLPDTYWPRLSDGALENITKPQQAWARNEEYGATGLIASLKDYIRILEGLNNGELVNSETLNEMKNWIQGSTSQEPDYGLGLLYLGYKGKPNYGHDGDGIGATILLLYFPTSKTYVVAAANASMEFGGGIATSLHEFKDELGNYLAGF